MRKITTLFFLFAITACLIAQQVVSGYSTYELQPDNTATLIRFTGNVTYHEIPDSISYQGQKFPVTVIGDGVFDENNKIDQVRFPKGLKKIGENAFYNSRIRLVELPEGLEVIGRSAFSYCKYLGDVVLPQSVREVENSAFSGSGLRSVTLPDANYGKLVFGFCKNLKEIEFPQSLTIVPDYFCEGCTSLERVKLSDNTTRIKLEAFKDCYKLSEINLPQTINYIESGAFVCCNFERIVIPEKVRVISSHTFIGCTNLKEVVLHDAITHIDYGAFEECTLLQSISIPAKCRRIGRDAFRTCTSLNVPLIFPEALEEIESSAFHTCKSIPSVTFLNPDTKLNQYCFLYNYKLEQIILPENLQRIPESLLDGCHELKSITIPASVKTIDPYAFHYCLSLQHIHVLRETPPEFTVELFNGIFNKIPQNCVLHVKKGLKTAYAAAKIWGEFAQILEDADEDTGLTPSTGASQPVVVRQHGMLHIEAVETIAAIRIFDLNGKVVRKINVGAPNLDIEFSHDGHFILQIEFESGNRSIARI